MHPARIPRDVSLLTLVGGRSLRDRVRRANIALLETQTCLFSTPQKRPDWNDCVNKVGDLDKAGLVYSNSGNVLLPIAPSALPKLPSESNETINMIEKNQVSIPDISTPLDKHQAQSSDPFNT